MFSTSSCLSYCVYCFCCHDNIRVFSIVFFCFFFFKQKTAYEMRISDWSSDVCSSDLVRSPGHGARNEDPDDADDGRRQRHGPVPDAGAGRQGRCRGRACQGRRPMHLVEEGGRGRQDRRRGHLHAERDRKSVVQGKSVSARVDRGGRRIIKKKKK